MGFAETGAHSNTSFMWIYRAEVVYRCKYRLKVKH
jgi:hypothetical protein